MVKIHALSRNNRIHLFLFIASLLIVIVPVLNKTPSYQISEKSVHAAAHFLFLVDTEEYAKSWEVSSETLKKMLTQEAWNDQITKIRAFLGPIIERVQHDISYTDTAGDVLPGEYVIMTFISRFELRERVTETITLLLGDNGQWQVVGYFLK
jgi:hypothetical protein